jgi:DNA-directed RNA polymerase specialized sigma24 family protein
MDLFTRIEADVRARRESGALGAEFRRWREGREELRRFADVEELVTACRDGTSRGAADLALRGLCAVAREGDQSAGSLLVWLLLPGLLSVRSGLRAEDALPREDLDAELVAGVWEAAASLVESDRHVARRLVNAARWRVLAAMRESIEWAERTENLDVEPADESGPAGWDGEAGDALAAAVREGVLSPEDAQLLVAARERIRALGEKLGLSLNGVQSRRFRARQRLRDWVETSREPPANLSPGSSREPPAKTR